MNISISLCILPHLRKPILFCYARLRRNRLFSKIRECSPFPALFCLLSSLRCLFPRVSFPRMPSSRVRKDAKPRGKCVERMRISVYGTSEVETLGRKLPSMVISDGSIVERLVTNTLIGRWDDWVPQDRLRKLTEENKELARNLREEAQSFQRNKDKIKIIPGSKKRGADSVRESEERHSSVAAANQPRAKRARDVDVEKVNLTCHQNLTLLLLSSARDPLSKGTTCF